ncbi:50S ribosomal protein L25/general stress protein Ctc [Sneathiella chungangensis]|uniref:Large ribosomal subunit protein bL25 n=1 Tax=Sneathiella chungangensis TaxID=1418234 RepID=A0A845MFG3_9PROT|nr:50S ribosomal protein L25/general stress protein Ctc [Sneathiella chungangensis]MZR22599.1 50S ribosomal protein L25/general stress protein Ctc [Sneathiella chungangensis]
MSENAVLIAETRDRVGKGTSRALRRDGRTPAVIYGDKKEPISISLETKELVKAIHRDSFLATVYTVQVGSTKHNVLPRDMQLHPVNEIPVHVDFLRVSAKSQIAVMVPVHFLNEEECVGLKRGGVLNIVRHEIEMMVPAGNIPEAINIDLLKYDIGDSVHISEVALPEGAAPTITDRDFTIATIAAPTVEPEPEEEGEGEDAAETEASAEDEGEDAGDTEE